MTPTEIDHVSKALELLRKGAAMRLIGLDENASDMEREARVVLVGLLQSSGVDTDQLK